MNSFIKSKHQQFVQDLETIVNIDSGSGNAAGIARVAGFFHARFERLGWNVTRMDLESGQVPCLEIVNQRGKTAGKYDFLLLGHMDTVFPEGTAAQRPFTIRDGRAFGPGVCDMKAGLLTILHVAEAMQRFDIANDLAVCIAFNGDEEVGTNASRPWLETLAARSRRVLVFEPCRATGHRVLQRKGLADFEIACYGGRRTPGSTPRRGPTPSWRSPGR